MGERTSYGPNRMPGDSIAIPAIVHQTDLVASLRSLAVKVPVYPCFIEGDGKVVKFFDAKRNEAMSPHEVAERLMKLLTSASWTSSDRAPFGVAAVADAGGFGVAAASADCAAARVVRAITRIIGSDSGWACWPAIESQPVSGNATFEELAVGASQLGS
jgi:hypothetical protein